MPEIRTSSALPPRQGLQRAYQAVSRASGWRTNLLLLVCLAGAVGCKPSGPQEFRGAVTYQGNAVQSGDIVFAPTGQGGKAAAKIADGEYSVTLTEGQYSVSITAVRETGKTELGPYGEPTKIREQFLPPEYNSRTRLTATVGSAADSPLDFNLE